ncbi:citrate lyase subunit beta/citryl-CoA lyase [Sporomusaceae bacterium BoRhaA]|uniref:HpcH/HpaI aldolase/citrate lyase family protein n=1 Tax=Pelorhabdus rhamnosifermentans TaxID=2772457 RepID=UPI001FEC3A82|nr:citrate lyase subunit beta/citryl-CoA lyase [Pelorhabdus rhamnosifermentans]
MIVLRRSLLFLPGNNPGMLQNGGVFGADGVILDLEDAVAPTQKDAARLLVTQALQTVDYENVEKIVRVNPLDTFGTVDIPVIVACQPDALLIPKVESADDVLAVVKLIEKSEKIPDSVKIIALLETPKGIAEAYSIAKAHPRLVALALGAEDYTAGLGSKRTKEGGEIYSARMQVINSAAAAGIQSIDTPFTDANDPVGLMADTELAKSLGFKGKLSINPRQIDVIHSVFNPTATDIEWATRVVAAIEKAKAEGSGVVSMNGKMIDAPIVSRAETILLLAERLGLVRREVR